MFATSNQVYIFLCEVALGVYLGIMYTLTHFFARSNNALRVICDVVYSLCAGALVVYCNVMLSTDFRLYMLLAIVVGVFFYLLTLRPMLDKGCEKMYNFCKELFTKVKRNENICQQESGICADTGDGSTGNSAVLVADSAHPTDHL